MGLTCCLIVDDHEQLRNLMSSWLKSIFPEVYFIDAVSGEAALDLSSRYHPQVVLMDVGLPGMNGIEAARQIKRDFPQTFVIIHTIYDEQAYRLDAAEAGVDAFIVKSRSQSDLIPILSKAFAALNNSKNEEIPAKRQ